MGTPGFIAPEQYLGGEVDHRVDVFAAGVVFYKLLTGRQPFSGSTEGLMYKVCHETATPPSIQSGNPALARFDAIAMRALAKRPQDRYPSADQFRSDLLAIYNQPVSPALSEETLIRVVVPVAITGDAAPPKSGAQKSSPGGGPTPLPDGSSPHVSTMPTQMLIAAGWNIQELGAVERSLMRFLGPIARVMVRRAARQAQDFESLVNLLAGHLQVPAERAEFLRQNAQLATGGTGPSRAARVVDDDATVMPGYSQARPAGGPGPTPEEVARAARLLAGYLGPIAQVLVRDAARPGVTRAAFLAGLADRLRGPNKERFLNEFEQSTL